MAEEQKKQPVKKSASTTRKTPAKSTATRTPRKKPEPVKEEKIEPTPVEKPVEAVEPLMPAEPIETVEHVAAEEVKPEIAPDAVVPEAVAPEAVEAAPTADIKEEVVIEAETSPKSEAAAPANEIPSFGFNEKMRNVNVTEALEKERKTFYPALRKNRMISYLLMGTGLVLMVVLFIFLFMDSNKFKIAIYVLLGVTIAVLVGNLVYNRLTQKKQGAAIQKYVADIMVDIASVCYADTAVKNIQIIPNSVVKDSEVINAHLFTVINKIKSRCRVTGDLNGRKIVSADVSVVVPTPPNQAKGRNNEVFGIYGKYFAYDLALANKEAVIIMRKSEKSVLPNHLIGYHEVTIDNLNSAFVVYGTSDETVNKLVKQEMVDFLNSFELSTILFDYVISLNEHGSFMGLNYSDAVMALPINKPVEAGSFEKLKADTEKVCEFFSLLK